MAKKATPKNDSNELKEVDTSQYKDVVPTPPTPMHDYQIIQKLEFKAMVSAPDKETAERHIDMFTNALIVITQTGLTKVGGLSTLAIMDDEDTDG